MVTRISGETIDTDLGNAASTWCWPRTASYTYRQSLRDGAGHFIGVGRWPSIAATKTAAAVPQGMLIPTAEHDARVTADGKPAFSRLADRLEDAVFAGHPRRRSSGTLRL